MRKEVVTLPPAQAALKSCSRLHTASFLSKAVRTKTDALSLSLCLCNLKPLRQRTAARLCETLSLLYAAIFSHQRVELFLTNELMGFRRGQSEKRTRVYERERDERTAGRGRGGRWRARARLTHVNVTDFPRVPAETSLWRGPVSQTEASLCCVCPCQISPQVTAPLIFHQFTINQLKSTKRMRPKHELYNGS